VFWFSVCFFSIYRSISIVSASCLSPLSLVVITPNGGRQPRAIRGSLLKRPDQMSHCLSLTWGDCGGREFPRTGRGAHPVLAPESLGQRWAEVKFIGHMRKEILVEISWRELFFRNGEHLAQMQLSSSSKAKPKNNVCWLIARIILSIPLDPPCCFSFTAGKSSCRRRYRRPFRTRTYLELME
jgi:hypothetical protein